MMLSSCKSSKHCHQIKYFLDINSVTGEEHQAQRKHHDGGHLQRRSRHPPQVPRSGLLWYSLSSPRAKRAGPKGLRAESARAVREAPVKKMPGLFGHCPNGWGGSRPLPKWFGALILRRIVHVQRGICLVWGV